MAAVCSRYETLLLGGRQWVFLQPGWRSTLKLGVRDVSRLYCCIQPNADGPKKAMSTLDSYFEKLQGPNTSSFEQKPIDEGTKPTQNVKELTDTREAEYTLKEELLINVLKEFEAADAAAPASKISADSRTKEGGNQNLQEGTPTLLVNPKGEEVVYVQPGSFLISLLVGINVGVYLFGFASSQQTENGIDLSFLYGAKVNDLILSGEWWRLVTPIFLHSGFLDLSLSSWALLSFGPQVESLYGSLGFLIIYLLGGSIGNLISFLETPAVSTVGGTAPVFAIICSWVAFLLKNRSVVKAFNAPQLAQKVFVFAALSLVLAKDGLPIDSWTHLGAGLTGLLFGLVGSPWYHLVEDDGSKNSNSKDTLSLILLLSCCGAVGYYIGLQS